MMQIASNLPPCTPSRSKHLPKFISRSVTSSNLHFEYSPALIVWDRWVMSGSLVPGPSLPLDYFTDYSGGAMFALARAKEAVPGPPQLGALMKLRRFDRCALNAIVAYRSYAGHRGENIELVMNHLILVWSEWVSLLSLLLMVPQNNSE